MKDLIISILTAIKNYVISNPEVSAIVIVIQALAIIVIAAFILLFGSC